MEKSRVLDRGRSVIRIRHYRRRTEQGCVYWIRQFILFHNKRHPLEMGKTGVESYLTWLAGKRKVAAVSRHFY